jgi:hypothetical protein
MGWGMAMVMRMSRKVTDMADIQLDYPLSMSMTNKLRMIEEFHPVSRVRNPVEFLVSDAPISRVLTGVRTDE